MIRFPITLEAVQRCALVAVLICGLQESVVPRTSVNLCAQEASQEKPSELDDGIPEEIPVTLRGRCVDFEDRTPLSGVNLRLFRAAGWTARIVEIGKTTTDEQGEFEFPNVMRPRPEDPINPLKYVVFADMEGRPLVHTGVWWDKPPAPFFNEISIPRVSLTATGRIVDQRGKPIVGANVISPFLDGRPIEGLYTAVTDRNGAFVLPRLPSFNPKHRKFGFLVAHPDFPEQIIKTNSLDTEFSATLIDGCKIRGVVFDQVTGKPAARASVQVRDVTYGASLHATTNVAGEFEIVLFEGRYDLLARRKDRISVAVENLDCETGQTRELTLKLISGGFISGRVLNSATKEPITKSDNGFPITLGLFGPSDPRRHVVSPVPMVTVDAQGRYKVRAAPGNNFPYFVNTHGDRIAWNTHLKDAVVVTEGETTNFDMLITPAVPPEVKLKQARELLATFSNDPTERTEQILVEFRKLDHTVDETESWCMFMQDLVRIGRDAVPRLCVELDGTESDRMLRRLGFALRAIGDPRAVPALIRAIPRTLLPSSSDYGLLVEDGDLTHFMLQNDLDPENGSRMFGLGRPVREIVGAIEKLTHRTMIDERLFGISLSTDPRRQILQRRVFLKHAQVWQEWWDRNSPQFTNEFVYETVGLESIDEELPAPSTQLGPQSRVEGVISGATLSPAIEKGRYVHHFCDLDTGYQPKWPTDFPRDESKLDPHQLDKWADANGVDLMCVKYKAPNGSESFVLKSFGMKAWEITPRDLRNIDRLVAAGKLPQGHEMDGLLMHYDEGTKTHDPGVNAAFIYITKEGSIGVIEVTDRITQTADLTGRPAGAAPTGVGFFKGVKYNLKSIIP